LNAKELEVLSDFEAAFQTVIKGPQAASSLRAYRVWVFAVFSPHADHYRSRQKLQSLAEKKIPSFFTAK
jgi:hypothetical protein